MKNNNFFKYIAALFICAVCLLIPVTDAEAKRVTSDEVDYDNAIYISSKYASPDMYGCAATTSLDIHTGYKVKNITCKNKNLIVKKVYDVKRTYGNTTTQENVTLGFYAKKKGTYTVTFDVYKKNKRVATKKIKVYVDTAYSVNKEPFKSITFGGKKLSKTSKDKYYNLFTTKKSGKFNVKLTSAYKLSSILVVDYYNGYVPCGKNINSGSTIKLKTENVLKTNIQDINSLYPSTQIIIYYKHKKTGQIYSTSVYIHTLNKD